MAIKLRKSRVVGPRAVPVPGWVYQRKADARETVEVIEVDEEKRAVRLVPVDPSTGELAVSGSHRRRTASLTTLWARYRRSEILESMRENQRRLNVSRAARNGALFPPAGALESVTTAGEASDDGAPLANVDSLALVLSELRQVRGILAEVRNSVEKLPIALGKTLQAYTP